MSRPTRRPLLLVVALPFIFAGCASAAPPSPSGSTGAPPVTSSPPPSNPPGESSPGGGDGTDPGGNVGGGGGEIPAQPGQPKLVVPVPGQQMVHEVAVSEIRHQVDGRKVVLNVRWWSGVEPCSVLDSVDVKRDADTFSITVKEGTSNPDAMCVAMAMEKVTVVDLGELEPGTYVVRGDPGDAPPLTVVVP